jgi:tetratricopeptide (TPR) repeat protein
MAKQTRQRKSAGTNRKPATSANGKAKSRPAAKTSSGRHVATRSVAKPAAKPDGRTAVRKAVKTAKSPSRRDLPASRDQRAPEPAPPPPAPRKPGYYEALAMYESGVRALQRHDYQGAATQFRTIMERYPEERELQERSHLYLRVCERETARRPATPQTPQERVYAATVALNAGDTSAALDHLTRALSDSPESDHAHYIMSVALASKGDSTQALDHLRRAITLNSENRALARQDPDLEPLRSADEFRDLTDAPAGPGRGRLRKRR